jgi:hypothetical protein
MGKDLILDLGRYSDVVTVVRMNGKEKIVPWKALSKVQIGDMLEKGGNIIEIEVMGAPRNMFGPLHLADTREKWIGAGQLHPEGRFYTQEYVTYPWGLMEQVCIQSR